MSHLSDQEILKLVLNKDSKNYGFNLLIKKYQQKVYLHVRRMVYNHDDADDVTQNIFIKVFENIDKFREQAQLFTWIYRIATNEAISFLKKKKVRSFVTFSDNPHSQASALFEDPLFDGDAIQQKLYKAIEQLPRKQKLVFNMKYFDEMKYEEISAVLGTSVGALKTSYHHAVKKIEKQMELD